MWLQELSMNINEILNRNVIVDDHGTRFRVHMELDLDKKDRDRNISTLTSDQYFMYLLFNLHEMKMFIFDIVSNIINRVNIYFDDSGLPRYYHGTDNIILTKPKNYKSLHLFFSAMFHEITHWMIHRKESTIDKEITLLLDEEEIVAELVSLCIMEELGYSNKIKQYSLDYIDEYLEALRDNKNIDIQLSIEKMESLTKRLINQFKSFFYKECKTNE